MSPGPGARARDAARRFLAARGLDRVGDGDSLWGGTLDSMGWVRLALELERECGIRVRASDLTERDFGSIESIAAFVERRARGD